MVKKTYRRFSKKGLSKKNKLRKSKRKSLRSKRKSRKHGGDEGPSSGPTITKRYLTYGHLPCDKDKSNDFQYFLCELAKYYYYKMNKDTTREDAHKQKLIEMGIPEDKLDQFYNKVTAEDTADVIKQKLYNKLVIKNELKKILGPTPYDGIRENIWDAVNSIVFEG